MSFSVRPPYPVFSESDGTPLEDGYIWIGQANLDPQTNPISVYYDAGLTQPAQQPIRTTGGYPSNSGTPANVYVSSDYSIKVLDKNGTLVYSTPSSPYAIPAFGNTPWVNIIDYGGAPGPNDNTAAMNAAADALNSVGGGTIIIPYPGEWRMNWVCVYNNITVSGTGGAAEYNENCIRPYDIGSPPITFGDGTSIIRYCGLNNVHISGVPIEGENAAGVFEYLQNAPSALLFRGGVVNFTANLVSAYNGKKTVSIEPSATNPVTGIRFISGTIRNDIEDSILSRAIYSLRLADPGYNTDNKFILTKVNKPNDGYAAEIEGTINGISFEVYQSYWDFKPGWGILLKGGSAIVCDDLQLDPGTSGAVIIETDSDGEISRFINGNMRHGGQKFKCPSYTIDIPAEADTFAYKARLASAHLGLQTFWGLSDNPYSTVTQVVANPGNTLRFEGADVVTEKNVYVQGSTAINAGWISAANITGGIYVASLGTVPFPNQNVRVVAAGTGSIVLESSTATRPNNDGIAKLGSAGFKWSEVFAANGVINTSDERIKQQILPINDSVIRAWGKVNFFQYKMKNAVSQKGDKARWHFGVIAQRVKEAFESEGLDPFAYGILCYDEWEDEYEDVREEYETTDQVVGKKTTQYRFTGEKRLVKPAGNCYSIRYDEALILECAYLRSMLQK